MNGPQNRRCAVLQDGRYELYRLKMDSLVQYLKTWLTAESRKSPVGLSNQSPREVNFSRAPLFVLSFVLKTSISDLQVSATQSKCNAPLLLRTADHTFKPNLRRWRESIAGRQVTRDVETPLPGRASMPACATGNTESNAV